MKIQKVRLTEGTTITRALLVKYRAFVIALVVVSLVASLCMFQFLVGPRSRYDLIVIGMDERQVLHCLGSYQITQNVSVSSVNEPPESKSIHLVFGDFFGNFGYDVDLDFRENRLARKSISFRGFSHEVSTLLSGR